MAFQILSYRQQTQGHSEAQYFLNLWDDGMLCRSFGLQNTSCSLNTFLGPFYQVQTSTLAAWTTFPFCRSHSHPQVKGDFERLTTLLEVTWLRVAPEIECRSGFRARSLGSHSVLTAVSEVSRGSRSCVHWSVSAVAALGVRHSPWENCTLDDSGWLKTQWERGLRHAFISPAGSADDRSLLDLKVRIGGGCSFLFELSISVKIKAPSPSSPLYVDFHY